MTTFYTLAIESSCDETAVGIYSEQDGLIAHQLHSQVGIHNEYGGVVPELASRDHIQRTMPLVNSALNQANLDIKQLNGIAYTQGPGLAGALLVGASVAKSLAFALDIPSLGINHLEGHLLVPLLEDNKPEFPFLCLLVSGGHTMLLHAKTLGDYQLLGESLDDAAGEAFDKTAKLLGLGYPGGVALSQLAQETTKTEFVFPRPILHKKNLDFSFSGLKTFAKNTFAQNPDKAGEVALAFEDAITDVLTQKTHKALAQVGLNTLVVAGGVSANTRLRNRLNDLCKANQVDVFYPKLEFCTDNAAMIALAGHYRLTAGECDNSYDIDIKPRWDLASLSPVNL